MGPRTVPGSLGLDNWQLVLKKYIFVPQQDKEGGMRVMTPFFFFYRPRNGGSER